MDDASINFSYANGRYVAHVHLNKIKCSTVITNSKIGDFCELLRAGLLSSFGTISPLLGRSSATISQHSINSVLLHFDNINPVDTGSRIQIQLVVSAFVQQRVEFANLLRQAQSE